MRLAAFPVQADYTVSLMYPPQIQMEGGYCARRDSQPVKITLSNRREREIKRDGKECERIYSGEPISLRGWKRGCAIMKYSFLFQIMTFFPTGYI